MSDLGVPGHPSTAAAPPARLGPVWARVRRALRRVVVRRRRGLVALLLGAAALVAVQAATAPPPPTVPVLVAARDLPAGVVLGPDDVRVARQLPDAVPAGALGAPQVTGEVLAAPVRRGEPLTDRRLLGDGLVAAYPGLAAVPVRLPDAGMAALLRVGQRVDLVAAGAEGDARVVAGDVPVLALPAAAPDGRTAQTGTPGALVVVGATPGQADAVAGAAVREFLSVRLPG